MKDIYYLCEEFDDFAYPLEDEEIINEIFDYTTFGPFDGIILHGYTQKEIPEIMIAVNIEEVKPKETDISKIICELSHILNNYDLGIDGGQKAEIYLYGKILDKYIFHKL